MAEIGAKRRHYATRLAEAGHSDAGRDIPMARLVALAPTAAEAEAVARRGAQWLVDSYAGPKHEKILHTVDVTGPGDPIERYLKHVILHGTPDMVADRIAALRGEVGMNYLMAAPLSRQSFQLLADEVLPRIA